MASVVQDFQYKLTIFPSDFVSDDQLAKCATLFSSHYGIWGNQGPNPGEAVRLSPKRLRTDYLFSKECFLITGETKDEKLIAQAFFCRFPFRNGNFSAKISKNHFTSDRCSSLYLQERCITHQLIKAIKNVEFQHYLW